MADTIVNWLSLNDKLDKLKKKKKTSSLSWLASREVTPSATALRKKRELENNNEKKSKKRSDGLEVVMDLMLCLEQETTSALN